MKTEAGVGAELLFKGSAERGLKLNALEQMRSARTAACVSIDNPQSFEIFQSLR